MSLLHNITNAIVLYYFAKHQESSEDIHLEFYESILITEFKIILGIACFFNFLALLFLGHLVGLHIMLYKKGMTTFEYIRWK